jgi:glycosyltransferase involved in cell wall biosynthesis
VVAACSSREAALAKQISSRTSVVLVPNVAGAVRVSSTEDLEVTLVAVGRLAAQKDPHFFAEVVDSLRTMGVKCRPVWVGGGAPEMVEALHSRGIDVTGWLAPDEVYTHLQNASCYVHSALWEGFPMTILEAAALGVPIVAREIPATAEGPTQWLGRTPEELAVAVSGVLGSPRIARDNVEAWTSHLSSNNVGEQAAALVECYGNSTAHDRALATWNTK